MVRPPIHSC